MCYNEDECLERDAPVQSGRKVPTFSEALPASLTKEAVEAVKSRYISATDSTVSRSEDSNIQFLRVEFCTLFLVRFVKPFSHRWCVKECDCEERKMLRFLNGIRLNVMAQHVVYIAQYSRTINASKQNV